MTFPKDDFSSELFRIRFFYALGQHIVETAQVLDRFLGCITMAYFESQGRNSFWTRIGPWVHPGRRQTAPEASLQVMGQECVGSCLHLKIEFMASLIEVRFIVLRKAREAVYLC